MSQIFRRSTNYISKFTIYGAVFLIGIVVWLLLEFNRSSYYTQAFFAREQPVQFSHKHHVGDDGIDCRYCHTTVEKAAFAGIPSTKTCMNCHTQIWADSPYLEPVRASWRTGKSIRWKRVHDLPDFVYFNHSIHVNKGVGCSTCHGRVDLMPLTHQVASLNMEWCLACHRNPEQFIRPKEEVFTMDWPPANNGKSEGDQWHQEIKGPQLVKEYGIKGIAPMTDCNTCHR